MDKNKCTITGTLSKVHGYRGDLILRLKPEFSYDITGTEIVFIEIKGLLVPFFISPGSIQVRDANSLFIKFDDIDNESVAKELLGSDVYTQRTDIIEHSVSGKFTDYISFRVVDKNVG